MKSICRAVIIIAAFVFLLPLSAHSEIRAGSVEVNPYAGVNFFQSNQNLKPAPVFGARLGYNITKYFGVEIGGQFLRTDVDNKMKMDYTEGQFGYPTERVDLYFYHVDAIVHILPDSRFTPFIIAGFGGAHYEPKIHTREMAAFNVGVGAKFSLTENIALRVDVQDYIVTEIMQSTYHNLGVTAGIAFSFGGSKPVAEPVPAPVVEPAPVAPPAPPAPEIIEQGRTTLTVLFDFDKSIIKVHSLGDVNNLVDVMRRYSDINVTIEGHTDSVGTNQYNKKLSQRRANAVKNYMIQNGGIDDSRLNAVGYGEERPVASNATAEGRAKNRRVEAVADYYIKK